MDLKPRDALQLQHGIAHAHEKERASHGSMGADIMILHAEA
jgi:hypothetical protein